MISWTCNQTATTTYDCSGDFSSLIPSSTPPSPTTSIIASSTDFIAQNSRYIVPILLGILFLLFLDFCRRVMMPRAW